MVRALLCVLACATCYVVGVSHGYAEGIQGEVLTWSLVSGGR